MNLVLFTSLDAGRAAMAAAFFNTMVEPSVACAIAATPDPARSPGEEVTKAMAELEPEVVLLRPCRLTAELGAEAAHIINVGEIPHFFRLHGISQLDWSVPDPQSEPLEVVRTIRDQIQDDVSTFLETRAWQRTARRSAQEGRSAT